MQVSLYDRKSNSILKETVYKQEGLHFLYNTRAGRTITRSILNKRIVSSLYGLRMKSKQSLGLVEPFVKHYNIDLSEIKEPMSSFKSFNEFFIRELKPGARHIDKTQSHLISPADARLRIFDLEKNHELPVKGYWYTIQDLLKNKHLSSEYEKSWCYVYRLAPADYHRYAYIDNGYQEKVRRIRGVLHSVHPIALSRQKSLLARNYREITLLYTENFDKVVHIEIGALLVGKIVQRYKGSHSFSRGDEKGWFEFGGSTIIQLFKKDTVTPDKDILEYSEKGIETLVKVGEKTGSKI